MSQERAPNADKLLRLVDVGTASYVFEDKFSILGDMRLEDLLLPVVCL